MTVEATTGPRASAPVEIAAAAPGAARHAVDHPLAITAALLILVFGSLNYPLTPILVGVISDHLPISPAQAGLVATADMLGMFAASAAALFWVRRLNWRHTAFGMSAALVGAHVLSGFCTELAPLLAARFVAGFFAGSMMALGNTVLGDSTNPERKTAIFNIVQQGACSIAFLAIPAAVDGFGSKGAFGFLALYVLPALGLSWLLPAAGRWPRPEAAHGDTGGGAPLSGSAVGAIVAATLPVFMFFLAFGASWTYIERIGVTAGFTHADVAKGLSIATVAGMAGSTAAWALGVRFGRVLPLLATTVFQLVALGLLGFFLHGFFAYAAALAIYGFFMNFATSYQIGVALQADRTGRGAVIFLLMLKAGVVVGPLAGAALVGADGFTGPLVLAAVFFALSFLVTCVVARANRSRPAANPVAAA
ncbi:MFS transporter [Phenylobacterium sp.]|uniref:MFS transporter n=1 Tax=Phenylobacterium sp. TaxID=1871053 RepID=UPI0035B2EFA4